jgi:hypothetical protein
VTWWDEPSPDLGGAEPAEVVDLLTYAYRTVDEARRLALTIGIDFERAGPTGAPREAWLQVLTAAAAHGQLLELMAVVLHDPASSAFHEALRSRLGRRLGEVNVRIGLRFGVPPPPTDGPDAVAESITGADVPAAGASGGHLQAISSVRAGLGDPRAVIQILRDFALRTALIEVQGHPSGTGFLVGDALVLTAAHVLDRTRWPPAAIRPVDVYARFDFAFSGRSPAETGMRMPIAEFVTGSLPTQSEIYGVVGSDWDAPGDRLDFALLRLASPVPAPADADPGAAVRGYYPLLRDDYDYGATSRYMIMEHPLGGFVQSSDIEGAPVVSPRRTRMRYGGNTLNGASGSAVVDYRGRLVGMHHFSSSGQNQGIPIAAIARALLDGEHAALFQPGTPVTPSATSPQDPFATSAVLGTRPFVNRHDLRATMRDMAERRNGVRTLAINGTSGAGVSYSYALASHVADQSTLSPSLLAAAPGGLRALVVDLRAYFRAFPVDRVRAEVGMKLLLDVGIIQAATDPLAQEARETLTLVRALEGRLKNSNQQWWFFFDSIDSRLAVKQGDVDELIHALIVLADDPQVPLRVVLAGREAREFAREHTSWAAEDNALGLTPADVESWLRQRAHEERREIDDARLAAKLAELFPTSTLPEAAWLAPRLPLALLGVLAP